MARLIGGGEDDDVKPIKRGETNGEAEMNEMYYFESYDETDIHSAMINVSFIQQFTI